MPGCLPGAIILPHSRNARFLSAKYDLLQCAPGNVLRNSWLFATVKTARAYMCLYVCVSIPSSDRRRNRSCGVAMPGVIWVGAFMKDASLGRILNVTCVPGATQIYSAPLSLDAV